MIGHRDGTIRRVRRGAAASGLALVLATPLAAAVAAGQARHEVPRLVLVSRDPVRVTGSHFRPRTQVRITLVTGATRSHTAMTNAQGTVTTTFGAVVIDRCSAWSVTATQRGLAPVVIRGAKPQCPPA